MFHTAAEIEESGFENSYQRDAASPGKRSSIFQSIVTRDADMQRVFRIAEKVSDSQSTVLILGESGTGKELIARAIHEVSGCTGAFVPVNCGAIPDNLLESELFGHERGAFTGAVASKPGRFVLADNGTIFLDEIGEMSPHLQVKLLRVLQDKVVESVGGTKPRKVNLRVIAATHVDLKEKVKAGTFREDLYYRLQVVPVELPPLRARTGDISILLEHFSKVYAKQNNRRPLLFSREVLELFSEYSWPGNVRELENLVERLSVLSDGDAVYLSDIPDYFKHHTGSHALRTFFGELPEDGIDFNAVIDELENCLISQALERTGGNKKAAARLLRLNRTTLVEKIKKKGLEASTEQSEGMPSILCGQD